MIYGIISFFTFIISFDKNYFFVINKSLNSNNSNDYNILKNETKRKLQEKYDQIKIIVDSKCLFQELEKNGYSLFNQEIIKNSIERAK